MNRNIFLLFSLSFLAAIFQQCAPSKTISTQGAESYSEDLSSYRINYTDSIAQATEATDPIPEQVVTTTSTLPTPNAVTQELSEYFEAVDDLNQEKNEYQGYTLQVYAGGSREQANEAKLKVYEVLPDAEPEMSFGTIFRTRVGEYATRLEAQKDYIALRKVFPNVLPVPATFPALDN